MNVTSTTGRLETMLGTLRSLGEGWHTRAEIAQSIGKERLNPKEVAALELLAELGRVDVEMQPTKRPHINQAAYRIKEGEH